MSIARLAALSIMALLLLLAACGGDDDDDTDSGDNDEPAVTSPATGGDDDDGDDDEPTDAPDDGNGNGNGSSIDVCSLLTPEEVSAAIGEDVGEGEPGFAINSDGSACEWTAESGNSVFIEVVTPGGAAWFDTVNFGQDEDEPVEGIGDKANFDFIGVLDVAEGDVFVSVQPILFGTEVDDQEVAITLAQMILDRVD